MLDKLHEACEKVLDWLAGVFGIERFRVQPPDDMVEDEDEYHTLNEDGPDSSI